MPIGGRWQDWRRTDITVCARSSMERERERERPSHHHNDNSQEPHFHGGRHHHNFHSEQQNDSNAYQMNGTFNNSTPPLSGQKRPFSHPIGSANFVKLYVAGIPKTSTEQDIRATFEEHGDVLEVVLLKDKRTGLQQECCFVKYATLEQAERAIGAFHSNYIFPGAANPLKVRYADRESERLGMTGGAQITKLYVGCLNRQALKWDIEEIFSPFGVIEEIFIVRDEFKQNRGCAFVQYTSRDMALAAIQALHGTYVMRGCDQPLIVRFADPKKPRVGDSRPSQHVNDTTNGHMMSNEVQQMKSSDAECKTAVMTSNGSAPASHTLDSIDDMEPSIECEWSEHVSPDGDLYYYNCVTCESRWEKPEDYELYEQQLDNLEEQQQDLR
ncbi:flowering time control protein FCA-like isoform X2 [Andrographis paniculata]|uniref:flowering time control protein FCA-like isoform X2 n=1 Tax=Andrographis paniculata TaxID=175694 RepID=UPI0021E8CB0D|nr:flowering time control protein FCA-like isoform X2 [Andrographis paniculata]